MFFLESAVFADPVNIGALLALGIGVLIFYLVVMLGLWIYMSLAFKKIADKNGQKTPGLAWIPGIGPLIVAFKASKMPSWPWWLLFGYLVMWIPIIGFIIGYIALIVFSVYSIIWQWKMFEAVGKQGWWVLLSFIPFVGPIIYLVLVGITAWGN